MKSLVEEDFWEAFTRLPPNVQSRARRIYRYWKKDPYHPSLHFKEVIPERAIYSVRVGLRWRVLGRKEGDCIIWFWIGSHEDYNKLVAQLRRK